MSNRQSSGANLEDTQASLPLVNMTDEQGAASEWRILPHDIPDTTYQRIGQLGLFVSPDGDVIGRGFEGWRVFSKAGEPFPVTQFFAALGEVQDDGYRTGDAVSTTFKD